MTTEKLAKGMLTLPGGVRYARTHDAFLRFVRVSKENESLQRVCGFQHKTHFAAYLNGLLPLAAAIENLSPEGFDHPNPEYPWEAGGVIFVPVEYDFTPLETDAPQMQKVLKFIENCFQIV